jgi:hypothetical protein
MAVVRTQVHIDAGCTALKNWNVQKYGLIGDNVQQIAAMLYGLKCGRMLRGTIPPIGKNLALIPNGISSPCLL